jgi:pimeloyl-ACP methyl ester carboxylesterase
MSADAPRVHSYIAGGAREFMLAYGPPDGPQLLVLQPLFEEMNRCRALMSALCRDLARRDIGCWLPDLPGTGESPRALESVDWSLWTEATGTAAALIAGETGRQPDSVAIRGGALLDMDIGPRRWRFAPASGRSLLSDLRRSALIGGDPSAPAGYRLSPALSDALHAADVVADDAGRTIRLVSDDRPADRHVEASPIWRRPEPTRDDSLAALLADDIVKWQRA